jgi:hypothetical protein
VLLFKEGREVGVEVNIDNRSKSLSFTLFTAPLEGF